MDTLWAIYGLGFGDDEDKWELCTPLYDTEEEAHESVDKMFLFSDLTDEDIRVVQVQVIPLSPIE